MASTRIESLSHGPHAVARIAGKVHLVRGGAPGDLAEIEVTEDKGRFAYARLANLLEAGPARRVPPCPFLPRCGGCGWQHIDEETQREAKRSAVRDAFAGIEGLANVEINGVLASPNDLHYRRRLSLRVQRKNVGFFAGASHDLVEIDECLLGIEALRGGVSLAREWVQKLDSSLNRIEVAWSGELDRLALIGQCDGPLADGDRATSERLLREEARLTTLVLHGRGFRHVLGEDRIRIALPDDEIQVRSGTFSQVNDGGNHQLIKTVLSSAGVRSTSRVADLYAGSGNLSIPLARHASHVIAIERDPRAIEAVAANADRLGLANIEGRVGHVHRVLGEYSRESFETIVLDPPRNGAAEAIAGLLELAARRIVYVSCNPRTLARDLGNLARDYTIGPVTPIDLFPQTPHIEIVACLDRK